MFTGMLELTFVIFFQIDGSEDEIANSGNYPNVRLFRVDYDVADTPLYDLGAIEQQWTRPDSSERSFHSLNNPISYLSA